MASSNGWIFTRLTSEIANKSSPLRQHLETRFPNRAALQAAFRKSAGDIRVPGGEANAGTLGASFDFLVRTVLDPESVPRVALAVLVFSDQSKAIHGVIDIARMNSGCRATPAPEPLLRAAWALALCTEVLRAGLMPGSPLQDLFEDEDFTTERLMELAPPNALEQLQQLHMLAIDELYSHLPVFASSYAMGPTFDASRLCSADADFIVEGRLVELKVRMGAVNKNTGRRSDSLSLEDIYQMLAYVLFDTSDRYGIRWVSFYSARYGQLTTWSLYQFMHVLSGQELDVEAERAAVWELLGGEAGASRV